MSDDPARTYARAAAAMSGLQLDERSLEAVTANLRILQGLYAEFASIDLPETLDPAAVLRL